MDFRYRMTIGEDDMESQVSIHKPEHMDIKVRIQFGLIYEMRH